MATQFHNLSAFDTDELPSKQFVSEKRFAIVVSDWNPNVTYALKDGAVETLLQQGTQESNVEIFHVPGTFELTYAANKLQLTQKFDAIIVIGCVIQGDTPHFTYVCQGVTEGITHLNARCGEGLKPYCPVIFSVLTTETMEQATDRAGGKLGNKGVEGAITAIKMVRNFG